MRHSNYTMKIIKQILLVSLLAGLSACASVELPPPDTALYMPANPAVEPRPFNKTVVHPAERLLSPDNFTGAERDFRSAREALKSGNHAGALLLASGLIEQYPGTPWYKRALFLVEQALIQQDLATEALAAMLRVQSEYPELADYGVFLMADYHAAKSRFSAAAVLYDQVVERYPASSLVVRASFRRAQALYDSYAYDLSAEAFDKFLQDYPRSEFAPAAGLGLGKALLAEANLAQSVRSYQNVWVRYPGSQNDPEVERALGELKAGGAEITVLSPEEWYERGRNLFRIGQYDRALEAFLKYLDLDAGGVHRSDAMFRSGVAQFHLGKRGEAAATLEKMAKEFPGDARTPEALYWTGKSYSKLGDWDRGVKAFQKLLDRFPSSEWADDVLFLTGNIHRESGDVKKALSVYGRLVQEYPDSKFADSAIWWRAWSHYRAGDYKKTEQVLQDLVSHYPRSFLVPQARYWQGRASEKRGDIPRAVGYFDKVLAKAPFTYYGYRAMERKARLESSGTVTLPDDSAEIAAPCAESPCLEDPLAAYDMDDGPPVWTEETKQLFATAPLFKRTLELMHLDLKKDASFELSLLQERLPKRKGALIGLSKAYFELGDYHRSFLLVLRSYERYLDGPAKGTAEDLWLLAYPQGHWESISTYARKYGQDPYFIAAIIREESQFRAEALSPAGARGLMQVMPATGEWAAQITRLSGFDREKLFDSDTGVNLGTWYISHLMKRFKNDPLLVAAAYNAGPEVVAAWINRNGYQGDRDMFVELIPFSETRGYVKKVMRNYAEYKRIYGRNTGMAAPESNETTLVKHAE